MGSLGVNKDGFQDRLNTYKDATYDSYVDKNKLSQRLTKINPLLLTILNNYAISKDRESYFKGFGDKEADEIAKMAKSEKCKLVNLMVLLEEFIESIDLLSDTLKDRKNLMQKHVISNDKIDKEIYNIAQNPVNRNNISNIVNNRINKTGNLTSMNTLSPCQLSTNIDCVKFSQTYDQNYQNNSTGFNTKKVPVKSNLEHLERQSPEKQTLDTLSPEK